MTKIPLKTVHEVLSTDEGKLTQMQKGLRKNIEEIYGDNIKKLAFFAKLSVELNEKGEGNVGGYIKI